VQLNQRRRERARIDVIRFKPLIASPAVGVFVMPAGAMVFLRSVAGCAADTTGATFTTSGGARTIKTPLLAAGASMPIGYIERGITVTPVTGFEVFIDGGLGLRQKIAEGA
jgi:hypothetical protein